MLSGMEVEQRQSQWAAFRLHFPGRWQLALRFGVVVGAPLAAGFSVGARPLGAAAAASALLIVLLGPPAYGIARRTEVLGVAVLVGAMCALGALIQSQLWLVVLLLLASAAFVVLRGFDRALATITIIPIVGLLIGSGSGNGLYPAVELAVAAIIGGGFVLLIDRVWPSSEHPSVPLEGRAGRWQFALLLAVPVVYLAAAQVIDWHYAAYAFAALSLIVILTSRRTDRRDLPVFSGICVIAFVLVQVSALNDLIVLMIVGVAAAGAWRGQQGVLPLWSMLGALLLLVAAVA